MKLKITLNEETFNISIRKFLKIVGVDPQRAVEKMLALLKERQSVQREVDLDRVRNLEIQIAQVDGEIDLRA